MAGVFQVGGILKIRNVLDCRQPIQNAGQARRGYPETVSSLGDAGDPRAGTPASRWQQRFENRQFPQINTLQIMRMRFL